jgi:hypothetical protein
VRRLGGPFLTRRACSTAASNSTWSQQVANLGRPQPLPVSRPDARVDWPWPLNRRQRDAREKDGYLDHTRSADASHFFFCIDGHTAGYPVRLIAGSAPILEGGTMSEKRSRHG